MAIPYSHTVMYGPVVTCFSMFTHVRITFIAFSVLLLSFCGAVHSVCDRILVFHVHFL